MSLFNNPLSSCLISENVGAKIFCTVIAPV